MKQAIALFIFLCCTLLNVHSQTTGKPVFFKDIPVDLHLQIGFLFIYILLGLLFFMIFIFSPRQRMNLFFSLFNISLALMILSSQFIEKNNVDVASNIISRLIGVNILLFILHALDRMKPIYYWFIAIMLLVDLPISIILSDKKSIFLEIIHISFTVICFFQMIAAFRNKRAGDWLIGMVALAVVVINLFSTLFFFTGIQVVSYATMGVIPFIITVSVVIYLALRYGSTNTFLEQQLQRVQVLSEENIKSEKEKQQMLAGQNEMLEKQVAERTTELVKSLDELKSTQSQLIQSEKMASLGELTAGIAHEIQNPLNFVNNFSEVNTELIEEMKEQLAMGNQQEAIEIANDIRENELKINHHGKRADAIVKGMLQHSRKSEGVREKTDINALCDEYLLLSYHGMRAKDKNLNADFKTDFDKSAGKINIVPQDIGRVLLNLINNAFYAVNERQKTDGENYKPIVSIQTKKMNNSVEITVTDNGNGIPASIKEKIFQPFFTTKPTGQGTGLGLSLSYDIVKAHGGEIKVETKEGEGSVFTIQIPII